MYEGTGIGTELGLLDGINIRYIIGVILCTIEGCAVELLFCVYVVMV